MFLLLVQLFSVKVLKAVKLAKPKSTFVSESVLYAFVIKAVNNSSKKGVKALLDWSE